MVGNNNAAAGLFEIGLIECVRSLAKVGESGGTGDNDGEKTISEI